MTPLKPYLIRTYYEWIQDNHFTPYLLIQANLPHVTVPQQYVDKSDDTIVLNVAMIAVNNLNMSKSKPYITFQAVFDEVICDVCIPYYAIIGIYAQENEEVGIMFELSKHEIEIGAEAFATQSGQKKSPDKHPHLRVIKND